jgi:oxalate decarboxylase/phosphoglucose isomerase-like protein (cupin superfamily)
MNAYVSLTDVEAVERSAEHGGCGTILFRRLLDASAFAAPVDFVDFTIVPPGSSIGRHTHHGNEELYFVVSGTPLMRVSGTERRISSGTVAVVRNDGWHELINDTSGNVEILVVQVRV